MTAILTGMWRGSRSRRPRPQVRKGDRRESFIERRLAPLRHACNNQRRPIGPSTVSVIFKSVILFAGLPNW